MDIDAKIDELLKNIMKKNKCKCGAIIKDFYNYCPNCGSFVKYDGNIKIIYGYMCPICKAVLDQYYATYCHNCGHRLKK